LLRDGADSHLAAGTVRFAAPVVGLPGLFPMFDKRANRVITFAERVQECFCAARMVVRRPMTDRK
jgi:cytochrome c